MTDRSNSFSALQRAENSSIAVWYMRRRDAGAVSVLFSEPKIPQSYEALHSVLTPRVSVLFSEPKIPQYYG